VKTYERANLLMSVHFITPIDEGGEVLRSAIRLRPHEEKRGIEGDEHVGEGWRALQDVSKVKLKVLCISFVVWCMYMHDHCPPSYGFDHRSR